MKKLILLLFVLFATNTFSFRNNGDIFGSRGFIENKGQFNAAIGRPDAKILFAYEHIGEKIYFTDKGLVYKFTKEFPLDHEEHEALERGKDVKSKPSIHYYVDVNWVGANSDMTVESAQKQNYYFTYGTKELNSYVYKKVTYKNVYDNIDIEYLIPEDHETGIKYNVIVHPGGDISKVKIAYSGDVEKIKLNENKITIDSKLDDLMEHEPVAFSKTNKIATDFILKDNIISFNVKGDYDKTADLVIDPWITNISSLTTNNYGFDVDYDYAGNLYVFGATGPFMIAKYSPAGALLWTFAGTVAVPAWTSLGSHPANKYMGNLVVNKFTGKTYTGQGFNNAQGARIIRIDGNGVYDNFITPSVTSWNEAWEMGFHCGTGNVYGIGGSIVSNQSAGIINQVTAAMNPISLTTSGAIAQDVVNATIDEQGNTFIIYASYSSGFNNLLCRVNAAFTGTVWGVNSTYNVMSESANKNAYIGTGLGGSNSNAFNCLAVNGNYLFYYDGYNLAAYNKTNGTKIAFTTIPGYVLKRQGGIDVDDCNNIYIGGNNGNILSYNFNGTSFTQLPSITLGATTTNKFVYDIKYEKNQNLLYVSGSGFVGTFSAINSLTCTINQYSVTTACVGNNNGSAITTVTTNIVNPIFSYTYSNATGTVAITSNTAASTNTVNNLTNGNYTVFVQINAPCGPINTMTFNINCLCSATAAVSTSCTPSGSSFSLNVSATSGFVGTPTYSWAGPGSYTSNIQNPTFTNGTYGTYTLTASSPGCVTTATALATPVSQFTPGITNTAVACYNGTTGIATTTVSGGLAPYTYTWSTSPPQNGATATNLQAGTYTCIVQDALNCVYSATTTVTQPPAVTVSVNSTTIQACTGNTIGLTATGSGGTGPAYTYTWSTTAVSPSITLAEPNGGTYTYTVTAGDTQSCTANTTYSVLFVQSPSLTVSDASICIGNSTVLTASGASTLTWLPGGTTGSTISLNPAATTVYTLQGATGFCSSQKAFTVTVNPLPTLTINKTDVLCNNGLDGTATITVNSGTAPYTYSWSTSPTQTLVSASNLSQGTYTGTVTDANGCVNSDTVNINVPPLFYVGINSSSLTVCAGQTIALTAAVSGGTGPSYTYTWTNNTNGMNTDITQTVAGTYIYSLSATDQNGCIASNSVSLQFNPLPIINVNSQTLCYGEKATFSASGGNSYFWPELFNTNQVVSITAITNTVYTVQGLLNGCYGSALAVLNVNPLPTATITSDKKGGCVPVCFNLTSSSNNNISNYSWYMNNALVSNTNSVSNLCFNEPGDYRLSIRLTDANGCKGNTAPYTISAWPLPFADFHFEGALTDVYNEVTFVDHSTDKIKEWYWYFGDGSTSAVQNPVHSFNDITTYQTFLVVTNNFGCKDTTSKTIVIGENPSLFVPNSFTPNGDGLNDTFGAKGINVDSYYLQVFDRWGAKLFESTDLTKQWDGTFKGTMCKNDVYVWKIVYAINKSKSKTITGHINLMK